MSREKRYGYKINVGMFESNIGEYILYKNTPKHETVSEWENRTGEIYPDDAPVYFRIKMDYPDEWKLHYKTIKESFKNTELEMIVANHHGKPMHE